MSPERIAELRNKPIDLSDIPEVTSEQAKEFYPRNLREQNSSTNDSLEKSERVCSH